MLFAELAFLKKRLTQSKMSSHHSPNPSSDSLSENITVMDNKNSY